MGWLKRRKNKKIKQKREPIKDDLSVKIKNDITNKKKDIYIVPGVDVADYQENTIKKQILIRPTDYRCPNCGTTLQNIKLDGIHFYCPECKVHHNWNDL